MALYDYQCVECGAWFSNRNSSRSSKRCPSCQAEYSRILQEERNRARVGKKRVGQNMGCYVVVRSDIPIDEGGFRIGAKFARGDVLLMRELGVAHGLILRNAKTGEEVTL